MVVEDSKKYYIIAGALFVVGLITYFYFAGRSAGKRKASGDQAKLPNSGSGIPKGWTPTTVVEQLHDAIQGLDSTESKQRAFMVAYQLTPDQLAAVYNAFNASYQEGDPDRNLYQWIKDEVAAPLFGTDYQELLLTKMAQLGLKGA